MLNVWVLLLAQLAVRLARCAVVVSFHPCRKFAVVGGIFAIPGIPSFAENDVPVGGPVPPRQAVVEGVSPATVVRRAPAAAGVETAPTAAVLETASASGVSVPAAAETAAASETAAAPLPVLFVLVLRVGGLPSCDGNKGT